LSITVYLGTAPVNEDHQQITPLEHLTGQANTNQMTTNQGCTSIGTKLRVAIPKIYSLATAIPMLYSSSNFPMLYSSSNFPMLYSFDLTTAAFPRRLIMTYPVFCICV